MKNVAWVLILAAATVVFFRHKNSKETEPPVNKEWRVVEIGIREDKRFYANCSLPSCFDLQRCMLEYDLLTVYIEPLTNIVDENGTVISPEPSHEFLEIRKALAPFEVQSADSACIFVPGVDFLNVHRFKTASHLYLIMNHVLQRHRNVLLFTMTPEIPFSRALVASPSPVSTKFRQQFDISIPLLHNAHQQLPSISKVEGRVLVPLINASVSVLNEYIHLGETLEGSLIIRECNDDMSTLCDKDGSRLTSSLTDLISSSDIVILDGNVPLFPYLTSLTLKYASVPIIIPRGRILPYSPILDWNRIACLATTVGRVPYLLTKINEERKRELKSNGQLYYEKHFSSTSKIVNATMEILAHRILPTKQFALADRFHGYINSENQIIPHISPSDKLQALFLISNKYSVEILNSYCTLPSIETLTIIWSSADTFPEHNISCSIPIHIISGQPQSHQIVNIGKRTPGKSQAILIGEEPLCTNSEDQLQGDISTWRTNPYKAHSVQMTQNCSMKIHHKLLLPKSYNH